MASAQEVRARARRPFGVRLYLAVAFAAVALIAAGLSYVLASGSSQSEAEHSSSEIAVGRTVRLGDAIGAAPSGQTPMIVEGKTDATYAAWAFNATGKLITPRISEGIPLGQVGGRKAATRAALGGGRAAKDFPGSITVVSLPVFRNGELAGAVLARAARADAVDRALASLRGHRLTAAIIAVVVAALLGALIASAITTRVKALAESAARISEGRLDDPLHGLRGRDEITDLGRAFETMRVALKDTFGALRSERDRLSAIFEALDDGVIVAGPDGESRFRNPAADNLILTDGRVIEALMPWVRRAFARGSVEHDGVPVGDRVYAINVHKLPAEGGVLMVVRDRTEELRREIAEREFVSNAAHELRNPIAGLSGAIEVLRAGAKDDPEAREHFLSRLAADAERVTRLTESLLTLARVEAVGKGGSEPLDVGIAVEDAAEAVTPPDGLDLGIEVEPALAAEGDSVLLRQVLVGLLTNAFKNTPAGGTVTLRARRAEEEGVLIEVADTGKGIAPEDIDRIFERFYRGSGSLEQEGFGLGLPIAKRMVDVMGGEIGVDSTLGAGSTFWVRLRVAKPAPTPVA
jgi:two-component system, OmpR family, sensor histidine kinase VicK